MSSKDKTSSTWSFYSEETGTAFAACNLCSSKIKPGKEWPEIIFKRKCLLFISSATIFSYAHGKKWKFPAKSGRQKIYPRNTRFRSGKIRLTGNKIEIRLFPVRQRNHGTGRFLHGTWPFQLLGQNRLTFPNPFDSCRHPKEHIPVEEGTLKIYSQINSIMACMLSCKHS